MGCEEIRDLLALYAGGEAHENERVAVEAHVGLCAGCARELDQYREMRSNLAALREEEAPPGTWKALWQGVRDDLFPTPAWRGLAFFDASLRYAAALMVGLALGVGIYLYQRPPLPIPSAAQWIPRANSDGEVLTTVRPEEGTARTVTATRAPFRLEVSPQPRYHAPRVTAEGSFYLPHVESIPTGGDRDY